MGGHAKKLFLDAFDSETLELAEEHPDFGTWSAAGKGKVKARPEGESREWWRTNGPGMVQAWVDWRAKNNWAIWVTPDGKPAIELDLVIEVADMPLKMVIDRVFVEPVTRQPIIVDLKTGARSPESDLQLGFYRLGIQRHYGVDVRLGAYWMARKGTIEAGHDLSRYTPDLMTRWVERFITAVEAGIFLPHPTFLCRACSMRDYCAAFGGSKSHMDPDSPEVSNDG